jgi:hypothetical protein
MSFSNNLTKFATALSLFAVFAVDANDRIPENYCELLSCTRYTYIFSDYVSQYPVTYSQGINAAQAGAP